MQPIVGAPSSHLFLVASQYLITSREFGLAGFLFNVVKSLIFDKIKLKVAQPADV